MGQEVFEWKCSKRSSRTDCENAYCLTQKISLCDGPEFFNSGPFFK
jgi:hypothetical protein